MHLGIQLHDEVIFDRTAKEGYAQFRAMVKPPFPIPLLLATKPPAQFKGCSMDIKDAIVQVSTRYLIRTAAQMRPGERTIWRLHDGILPGAVLRAQKRITALHDAQQKDKDDVYYFGGDPHVRSTHYIIDMFDDWHLADGIATALAAKPSEAPEVPSDKRICEVWVALCRWLESDHVCNPPTFFLMNGQGRLHEFDVLPPGVLQREKTQRDHLRITVEGARQAWQRELARLTAASAERERHRVVVQCQHEDEA